MGMKRLALTVAALLVPQLATAQFGSLAKKVKDKVTSPSATTTGTPTGKVVVTVTSDVVDRFLTGFTAERAERDRQEAAHARDGVGQLYSARDLVIRCDSMKTADEAHNQEIAKKIQTGDQQPLKDMPKWIQFLQTDPLHVQCNNNRAPQGSFFETLNSVQARQDTVGAKAAGLSVPEYGAVRERIAAYVLWTFTVPGRDVKGYTPEESAAIDAKKPQLYALLRRDYNLSGMPKQSSEL